MKKKIAIFLLALIATVAGALTFAACGDGEEVSEPEYVIMYSDGTETHTLTVKYGELFSIPKPLPYKEGFSFLGLFDDEVGGTQYVSSTGMCVAAFSDRRNVVLYPQFAASEFTLVLNYGVGQATNVTSLTVEYGQTVPQLPPDIVAAESEKYNFAGWYTQPDCGGKKVADTSGVSAVKVETLLDGADDSGAIKLYAGFVVKKYKISFYDCKDCTTNWNGFDSTPLSTTEVDHGTLIADVAPKTRRNGEKILKWTTSDTGFYGDEAVVKNENNYYVYEYEVTLSFDTADGEAISPIKGSNRQAFKLPENALREYYSFDYWKNASGTAQSGNGYFSCDTTLTACWVRTHYIVTYKTNGGNGVSDRHVEIGGDVAFPSATRRCFEFIGWEYQGKTYKQGDKLEMPSADITLSAQWKRVAYLVTYDDSWGIRSDEVIIGESVTLLQAREKDGYEFKNWTYGGKSYQAGATFKPTDDANFKADYKANSYTLTLNANGGNVSATTKSVTFGSNYTLPVPTHSSNIFLGWFTEASGGTKLTSDTGASVNQWSTAENTTVYAQWLTVRLVNLDSLSVFVSHVITVSNEEAGVILQGTKNKKYGKINIAIEGGVTDAYVYLRDANITGRSTAAVIGYSVQGSTRPVHLISEGTKNSLKAGGGNDAINVSSLTVSGTAPLEIYGGDGEKGAESSNGQNGGAGIRAGVLRINIQNSLTIVGGKGGVGGTGITEKDWGDQWADNATDGADGGDGKIGGNGGTGGAAIVANSITANLPSGMVLKLTGGNGGQGGTGGAGGTGQTGGYVGNAGATGDSRPGGKGGNGGQGGTGGAGATAVTVSSSFNINSGTCILQGGTGGKGGTGGVGGNGGNGGENGWIGQRGGTGGKGGDGGVGGTGGLSGTACNHSINKNGAVEVTQNSGVLGAGGTGGNGGSGGAGGVGSTLGKRGYAGESGNKGADGVTP